ncbi:hypothetical protein ABZ419_29750 [Streptomyces cinnamoneus]|uniref:hypothetical protein n=1 Tax=Streptomyces cinnamoneus TaxID=53446 RepID=UPI0033FEC84A
MNGETPLAPLTLATDSRVPVRAAAVATTADYDRYFHIARHAPDLLHASHATLAAWLRSAPGSVPVSVPDGPADGPCDALRRWKLGHQLFHLLLTTMNSTLDDTLATVGAARWASVRQGLERLRTERPCDM